MPRITPSDNFLRFEDKAISSEMRHYPVLQTLWAREELDRLPAYDAVGTRQWEPKLERFLARSGWKLTKTQRQLLQVLSRYTPDYLPTYDQLFNKARETFPDFGVTKRCPVMYCQRLKPLEDMGLIELIPQFRTSGANAPKVVRMRYPHEWKLEPYSEIRPYIWKRQKQLIGSAREAHRHNNFMLDIRTGFVICRHTGLISYVYDQSFIRTLKARKRFMNLPEIKEYNNRAYRYFMAKNPRVERASESSNQEENTADSDDESGSLRLNETSYRKGFSSSSKEERFPSQQVEKVRGIPREHPFLSNENSVATVAPGLLAADQSSPGEEAQCPVCQQGEVDGRRKPWSELTGQYDQLPEIEALMIAVDEMSPAEYRRAFPVRCFSRSRESKSKAVDPEREERRHYQRWYANRMSLPVDAPLEQVVDGLRIFQHPDLPSSAVIRSTITFPVMRRSGKIPSVEVWSWFFYSPEGRALRACLEGAVDFEMLDPSEVPDYGAKFWPVAQKWCMLTHLSDPNRRLSAVRALVTAQAMVMNGESKPLKVRPVKDPSENTKIDEVPDPALSPRTLQAMYGRRANSRFWNRGVLPLLEASFSGRTFDLDVSSKQEEQQQQPEPETDEESSAKLQPFIPDLLKTSDDFPFMELDRMWGIAVDHSDCVNRRIAIEEEYDKAEKIGTPFRFGGQYAAMWLSHLAVADTEQKRKAALFGFSMARLIRYMALLPVEFWTRFEEALKLATGHTIDSVLGPLVPAKDFMLRQIEGERDNLRALLQSEPVRRRDSEYVKDIWLKIAGPPQVPGDNDMEDDDGIRYVFVTTEDCPTI